MQKGKQGSIARIEASDGVDTVLFHQPLKSGVDENKFIEDCNERAVVEIDKKNNPPPPPPDDVVIPTPEDIETLKQSLLTKIGKIIK